MAEHWVRSLQRRARRAEELEALRTVVAEVLDRAPSWDPANDEPFALVGDGYLYWRLRHAYEATAKPQQSDGRDDA
jgi:hypothetical protein